MLYAGSLDGTSCDTCNASINYSEFQSQLESDDPIVVFVSGLEIGNSFDIREHNFCEPPLDTNSDNGYFIACQMLSNFINGRTGSLKDMALARNIAR